MNLTAPNSTAGDTQAKFEVNSVLPELLTSTPIGQLPLGWEFVQLRDVAESCSGGTPPKVEADYWHGPVPWLSPKDMKATHLNDTADHISVDAAARHSRVMPAETIFVVIRGMILAKDLPVAISTVPMAFNQDMKALRVNERILPEFLLYAIMSQKGAMTKEIGTSAHGTRRIGSSSLDDLYIPLPPLKEQYSIAYVLRVLEKASLVEAERLDRLKNLKSAALSRVFQDGLKGSKTKATAIGEIPEDWDVTELRNLLREPLRNGHSAPAVSKGEGVRTLTLTAVTKRDFSLAHTKVTSADSARVASLWLESGDIFVERANTHEMVGLAALYRGAHGFAIFPDLLIRVRVDEQQILPEVLCEWLASPLIRSYFQRHCSGAATSMPKIDQGTIERTLVPIPPMAEQELLRTLFGTLDARISRAADRRSRLQELFSVSLSQLMSGALRTAPLCEHQPNNHA